MISNKINKKNKLKEKLYEIIFEAETLPGKSFDLILIFLIIISSLVVVFESVKSINQNYYNILKIFEWIVTIIFTVEYFLRIIIVRKPIKYIVSFLGIIDLLSFLPTYLSLIIPGSHILLIVRLLRLVRIFRILKLTNYVSQAKYISDALKSSKSKIIVFLFTVTILVVIIGTLIYAIEGEENGFNDIPTGIYWAVVTLTTVGYGDISPQTELGRALAVLVMILGYSIIAVPTGIVTAEISHKKISKISNQVCPECNKEGHDFNAKFCKYCGAKL